MTLALVKQIRKSPQARAFFEKSCAEVEIPFLQLLNWIRTQWASLFNFLDRILKVQKVSGDPLVIRISDHDLSLGYQSIRTASRRQRGGARFDWPSVLLGFQVEQARLGAA